MRKAITATFSQKCLVTVTTFQATKAKLPAQYEVSLSNTQVVSQKAIEALTEQNNTKIDMQTKINQAQISAPIVINNAEAKVNATLQTNLA